MDYRKFIQAQRQALAGIDSSLNEEQSKVPLTKNAKEATELAESIVYGLNRLIESIQRRGAIISATRYEEASADGQKRLLDVMRKLDNELTRMTVPDLM